MQHVIESKIIVTKTVFRKNFFIQFDDEKSATQRYTTAQESLR